MKPRIPSEPFVVALAEGTARARKENRAAAKARLVRHYAGGDSHAGHLIITTPMLSSKMRRKTFV